MESILTSVKKGVGIVEEDENFDTDIITYINAVFMTLHQLGIGPEEGFVITDKSTTWSDYIPDEVMPKVVAVKAYMVIKVKMAFDVTGTGAVISSLESQAKELEWRITNHL